MIGILRRELGIAARSASHRLQALVRYLLCAILPLLLSNLLVGQAPASASILYSGGEDIDFTCAAGGSCSYNTDPQSFRAGWARISLMVNSDGSNPPLNRFVTPTFSAVSTVWVHAQYCTAYYGCDSNYSSVSGRQMLRIIDTNGIATLVIRGSGTNGQLVISSLTSAGVFTDLTTCPGAFGLGLNQLDLFVNYGTSGEVSLYNNSVRVCDFTGDVTNGDGAISVDQLEFAAPGIYAGSWSEVIVATTDTRAMGRFTANTVGDGNSVGFSGTNICSSIWNAIQFNDSSYGYTGSGNVVHECTVNNAIPPGSYSVAALTMSARALVGASGPQHFDFVTRTGGADYTSSDFAPTTSFSNISNYVQFTNPATSAAWTISDLQAAGFNVGLKAKP